MDMGLEIIYGVGALVLLTALILRSAATSLPQPAVSSDRRQGCPGEIRAE
ncbi:hypothetical protein [Bradyrhizobium sp. USDA 4452]